MDRYVGFIYGSDYIDFSLESQELSETNLNQIHFILEPGFVLNIISL
jgi:hypothetical protein